MNRLPTGFLLVLEGIDGAGKTTISNLLKQKLENSYSVIQTKEPGDSSIGETIRTIVNTTKKSLDPIAEYLLFAADRAQHQAELLTPALKAGNIVISDRLTDSSIAYQGFGRKISISHIAQVNTWAMSGIFPNLSVYLDIPVAIAIERIQKRNEEKTRFEKKTDFLEAVKTGFDLLFAENSPTRLRVDATKDSETICNSIYLRIQQLLPKS